MGDHMLLDEAFIDGDAFECTVRKYPCRKVEANIPNASSVGSLQEVWHLRASMKVPGCRSVKLVEATRKDVKVLKDSLTHKHRSSSLRRSCL